MNYDQLKDQALKCLKKGPNGFCTTRRVRGQSDDVRALICGIFRGKQVALTITGVDTPWVGTLTEVATLWAGSYPTVVTIRMAPGHAAAFSTARVESIEEVA